MRDERIQEQRRPRQVPQWKDEDLDDIMALLEKDYTKPQAPRREAPPVRSQSRREAPALHQGDDELSDLKALLEKDYTKPQPPRREAPASQADDELEELKALLEKDYTKPGNREKKQLPSPREEMTWDITGEDLEQPGEKAKKEKKAKKLGPKKEKKPLTEKEQKLRDMGLMTGFSAAIVAELTLIVYMVAQWVQWL